MHMLLLVPSGTIEQPHAIVNLKLGKKFVLAPEVSLANRMQHIRDAIRTPASLRVFEGCYAKLRNLDNFAKLFCLHKHPA